MIIKGKHSDVFAIAMIILMIVLVTETYADQRMGDLSYSPDHWPKRWSSAIRQQQNGKFPNRKGDQASLTDLPTTLPESVSEQDLFYSPHQGQRHGRADRRQSFNKRNLRHRYVQDARRNVRDPAFAYQVMFQSSPYAGMGQGYMSNPYVGSMPTIDPVLGHPGIGIPMMPGVPMGYPIGVMPYGYPGNSGMWNPYFGRR